ncbi:shikimate kinase [Candidatus Zinderia endosymbiont of Aphrophora alni]|uniref:shikimate kinase n=1 Tax=Candidatus Zinderia endosymbiont of Aphrophora alni TaxID=3077951 RepID=UPI0030D4D62E
MKKNIFFIGPMGVGKTTIGKILSKKINKKFIDSDYIIESILEISILLIFKNYGEFFFRKLEIKVIKIINIKKNIILSIGGGGILSFVIRNILKKYGIIIYLKININNFLLRINFLKNRPLLKINNLKNFLNKYLLKRNFFYKNITNIIINIKKKKKNIIFNEIFNLLK